MEGTEGCEIIPELRPRSKDSTVSKSTYNAFYNTRVQKELVKREIKRIILVGVSTDICLQNSAAGAFYRGYKLAVLSFGIRRMHPSLSPMLDYYAFMGGCDGVSSLSGAEAIGKRPVGTMPHSLVIIMGDQKKAFSAFRDVAMESRNTPMIALVDTYSDEKSEALMALEAAGKDRMVPKCETCGVGMTEIVKKYVENGKIIEKLPSIDEKREYVLRELERVGISR